MSAVEEKNKNQETVILNLENHIARLDQYGRRPNIEIVGITESISDKQLEITVIKILNKIGTSNVQHYDIVGCHRLRSKDRFGNRNTIVRFVNRKIAYSSLRNKKLVYKCRDMGFSNLSIVENLCPTNKSIFEMMNKLKSEGRLSNVWSYNGTIHFKYTNNSDEMAKKVLNKKDISIFFNSSQGKKNYIAPGNV